MQHIAACMGPLSAHCSLPELQALLSAFPLAKPAEEATRRLGQALALGSIAAHAPARYAVQAARQKVIGSVGAAVHGEWWCRSAAYVQICHQPRKQLLASECPICHELAWLRKSSRGQQGASWGLYTCPDTAEPTASRLLSLQKAIAPPSCPCSRSLLGALHGLLIVPLHSRSPAQASLLQSMQA